MKLTIGIGDTSSIDKECGIYRRGIKTPNYPGFLYLIRDPSDNVTRNAKAACGLMRLGTRHTIEDNRTWDCVKKPVEAIVTQDPAPKDNFLFGFGFIPSSSHSPQQCCNQKSTHFHPFCAKFNFVWGGRGGVASFSNITGKVPTILTSIQGTSLFRGHLPQVRGCPPKRGSTVPQRPTRSRTVLSKTKNYHCHPKICKF